MDVLFLSNYGEEGIGSTQEYLIRVMKRRGRVHHLRPRDGNILQQINNHRIPLVDYILMFEGELDHAPEVAKLKIPKVWWFYDSMIIFNQQIQWALNTEPDLVFIRDKRDVEKFASSLSCKTFWLPPGIDETLWCPVDNRRTYDIGFIGWVSDIRASWLNRLAKGGRKVIAHTEAPKIWGETSFIYDRGPRLEYNKASLLYSSSKLGFHHSFTGDITWRPMEVSACKTACLSDHWDALDDMFTPGKDIVVYNSDSEMEELSDYYLEHNEEREKIAEAAYNNVIKNHTWNNRLDIIENEVKKL